ncbi:MAG: recombinase family protein [Patescibacteria group bacterium]
MKYILYARKSTEDEDRQILSIEAQVFELKEFAAKEKLEIVDPIFVETKTAKEPGRIKFAEMLSLIERGKAEGILSWNPDRLARNSVDGGRVIHMIDRGLIKSLKFPTFWFEPTPQGLFMLQIAFGQSKYYVDSLRENVTRGMRQKVRNGVWPSKAPLGYLNNPKTRGIDVDREKAQKVKKIFELYATRNYNLREIAEWCKRVNLKSNLGNSISIGKVHELLQNVFYIGLMKYKGEIHEATHEPLISKKLFDKVQEIMREKGKPQKVKKHNFAFLGFMKCPCSAAITAEKKIKPSGREYVYYRCTKKKGPCQEKHFLRQEELYEQIKSFLQKVSLSSHDTENVLAELEKEEIQTKEQAKTTVQNLKVQLAEIEIRLEKLLDVFLNEVISVEDYKARKEKLLIKKVGLQEQVRDFEQNGLSWLEPAREFVLSLNQAAKLLKSENKMEMTTFLKNIGSNCILQNRQLIFSPRKPYDLVADPALDAGEATASCLQFPVWWAAEGSNPSSRNIVSLRDMPLNLSNVNAALPDKSHSGI